MHFKWVVKVVGKSFHHEFLHRKSPAEIPRPALPEGFATPSRNSPGFFGSLHRYHSSTVLRKTEEKFQIVDLEDERRVRRLCVCIYKYIYRQNPKSSKNPCASKSLNINISDLKSTTTYSQLLANVSATVKREKLTPERAMVSRRLPSSTTSEIFRPGIAS